MMREGESRSTADHDAAEQRPVHSQDYAAAYQLLVLNYKHFQHV